MRAIVDAHYGRDRTTAACLVFRSWADPAPIEIICTMGPAAAAYRSGRFYERELPILMTVLQAAGQDFETIVIDGYVHLQASIGKGLGTHLHETLAYHPAVVGVAKSPLRVADRLVPVCRGRSRRPLFVSAIGCPAEEAVRSITGMHGPYRIPTLLKQADQYARKSLKRSYAMS
jgi:deoxyribonuclease V